MGVWGLIQIVFDIFLMVGLGVCILRLSRRQEDDPRMSRGLQLLQSKLSILEDLSDRTDSQVQKITALLEQKVAEVQEKIEVADQRLQSLRDAVDQGIETIRLAQSSIKPEDVLEQKSSIKYTQAAKLAFEGHSIEQICNDLGINRAEAEFIVKVNRNSLRTNDIGAAVRPVAQTVAPDFSEIFDIPQVQTSPTSSLGRLSEEFRKANQEATQAFTPMGQLDFTENEGVLIPPSFSQISTNYIDIADHEVSPYAAAAPAPLQSTAQSQNQSQNQNQSRNQTIGSSANQPTGKPTVEQVMQNSRTKINDDRKPAYNHSRVVNEAPVVRKVIFPRIDLKS